MEKEYSLYDSEDSIRTFTGKWMNVFKPIADMIDIRDIAHALACIPRFAGHLPKFYSVAQHSIMCAEYIENDEHRLAALLHDASEAYLLDIPSPIKGKLKNYKKIENNLMLVIANKFGFEYPMAKEVKKVDNEVLQLEWDYLMLEKPGSKFKHLSIPDAEEMFLGVFENLNLVIRAKKNIGNLTNLKKAIDNFDMYYKGE